LSKEFPAVNLHEGELLAKREKLQTFLKNTQLNVRRWRETSQALAQQFGLDSGDYKVSQLKQLSRMAMLVFSEDKPEPEWFDAKYLEQVQETVVKANALPRAQPAKESTRRNLH
jgi:hypothetical protein